MALAFEMIRHVMSYLAAAGLAASCLALTPKLFGPVWRIFLRPLWLLWKQASPFARSVWSFFTLVCVLLANKPNSNDVSSCTLLQDGAGAPVVLSVSDGAEDHAITVTRFEKSDSGLRLDAKWSAGAEVGLIEVRAAADLQAPVWETRVCDLQSVGTTNGSWLVLSDPGVTHEAEFLRVVGHRLDADADDDGVPNGREVEVGSDPFRSNSDADVLSDGEELGTVRVLPADMFLWFDASGGYNYVWQNTETFSAWSQLWNGPHRIGSQDLSAAVLTLDGMVHLVQDVNWRQDLVGAWTGSGSLRMTDFSKGGVTVMALGADFAARPVLWGSGLYHETFTREGADYDVFEWKDFGLRSEEGDAPDLSTFEVIVPHGETNVVYVSYLDVAEAVRNGGPQVGVQDSSRRSALSADEFYAIEGPRPTAGTTVRYEFGTNTDPRVADPDWTFLGQSDDWVRAHFENADEILAVGYRNWVEASVGVDEENGLYALTARVLERPAGTAWISVGDTRVNLDGSDEYVFLLEKGRRYELSAYPESFTNVVFSATDDMGDSASSRSAGAIDQQHGHWTNDPGRLEIRQFSWRAWGYVVYHPGLCVTPGNWYPTPGRPTQRFTALLTDIPSGATPTYEWRSSDTSVFSIAAPSEQSTDITCHAVDVAVPARLTLTVTFSGATLGSEYVLGEDPDGQVRISLEIPEVMFVNDDDDDGLNGKDSGNPPDFDDDVVRGVVRFSSPIPTNGTIRVERISGYRGWVATDRQMLDVISAGHTWEIRNRSEMAIPVYFNPDGESNGYLKSGMQVRWIPENGYELDALTRFTVIEPVVEPICSEVKEVRENGRTVKHVVNPCGIVVGESAYFRVSVTPEDFPDSEIVWSANNGNVRFVGGENGRRGREVRVVGLETGDVELTVGLRGETEGNPRFRARVVEWSDVRMSFFVACDVDNNPVWTPQAIELLVEDANQILRQVGVRLINEPSVTRLSIGNDGDVAAEESVSDGVLLTFDQLVERQTESQGLKCYLVNNIHDVADSDRARTMGLHGEKGIALAKDSSGAVLAHEVGHAIGMEDIYESYSAGSVRILGVSKNFMPDDWNGGCDGPDMDSAERDSGDGSSRYYHCPYYLYELIHCLLMDGRSKPNEPLGLDITFGMVYGVDSRGEPRGVVTGCFNSGNRVTTRNPRHL